MRALLAILLLSVCSQPIAAERFYAEIHAGVDGIQHSDLSFRPIQASASVGLYFWKTIGIDFAFGGPLDVGEDEGFEVQLEDLRTLSLRFDSPPTDGISAFILLGVSQFDVSQRGVTSSGAARTVREDFQGGTLAIGIRQQIGSGPFSVVGSYRFHWVDEPLDVDSWTLGVRAAWK